MTSPPGRRVIRRRRDHWRRPPSTGLQPTPIRLRPLGPVAGRPNVARPISPNGRASRPSRGARPSGRRSRRNPDRERRRLPRRGAAARPADGNSDVDSDADIGCRGGDGNRSHRPSGEEEGEDSGGEVHGGRSVILSKTLGDGKTLRPNGDGSACLKRVRPSGFLLARA